MNAWPIVLVPAVVAALVAVLPLAYLLVRGFEQGAGVVGDILLRERTLSLVGRSLLLAAAVTVCCLVIGVSLAWLTTRTTIPARRVWALVATVPPQHMYGFESTVLIALVGGAAFDAGRPFYPADVAAALARLPLQLPLIRSALRAARGV